MIHVKYPIALEERTGVVYSLTAMWDKPAGLYLTASKNKASHGTTVYIAGTHFRDGMQLEQNTDTIHDLLSLTGTSLPSLTGSKHVIAMIIIKSEHSLLSSNSSLIARMPNLLCTREPGCYSDHLIRNKPFPVQ